MIYIKLDKNVLEKVEKITKVDYENNGTDLVDINAVNGMLFDLLLEIDNLKEKLKDLEQNLKDNYKPIPVAEQYGISDSDFI